MRKYRMLKYEDGRMYPLKKKTLYHDIWKHIQRETHLSSRQMFKLFPDLYKAKEDEIIENVGIGITTFRRKMMFRDSKPRQAT